MSIAAIGLQGWAEDEIHIGRSAAGQLKAEVEFAEPFVLPVSVFPGFSGYATGEVGIHSAAADDPDNDFFQLSPAADLRFILLAKDPGMEVWNDTGSAYMAIGESFYLGPSFFDTHPIWNLVTGTAGVEYSLTLKLHDVNGVYADSAPVVLRFTPIDVSSLYPLNIQATDAQHVALSWPTNAVGWALESATSMTTTNWQTVTNVAAVVGAHFSLSINIAADNQRFFRLRKQ